MTSISASNLIKNLLILGIFLVLGLVVFFWFGDYLFTGTDVYFPASRSASMRGHFFTWSSLSTGNQNFSVQIIFPYGLFLIISEKLNLSLPLTQHIWYYYIFVLSGLSAYLFSKKITRNIFNTDAFIPSVLAGILYMANPFVAVMSSTFTYQWLVYASMPLILYLTIIGYGTSPKLKSTIFRVLMLLILSSSAYTNPKYLILELLPCVFLFLIYACFERNKTSLKHTVVYNIQFFSLLVLFNLYWLVPQIYLVGDSIANVRQAYETLGIPRSLGYLYNSASGLLNGVSLIGHKALVDGYAGVAYYKYSSFLFSSLYMVVGLLPFSLFIYVIIVTSKKLIRNNYTYFFCIFLLLFSILGMLGYTPPGYRINSFFVEKVPLFLDLFAYPYPIFSIYYLVALSALVSVGIFSLDRKFTRSDGGFRNFVVFMAVMANLVIGWPVWTGELIRRSSTSENRYLTSHLYKVPDYYYLIKNKTSVDKLNPRILSIPYPVQGIVVYRWESGYSGREIGSGWVGNILYGTNSATKNILAKISSGDVIRSDLANLGIGYIIFHNDENPIMYGGIKLYGDGKRILEKNIIDSLVASGIRYEVNNFDGVILYTLKFDNSGTFLPHFYTYPSNIEKVDAPVLEFKKINPVKYRVIVHCAKGEFPLVFSESFDNNWKVYLAKGENNKAEKIDEELSGYKILDGNKDNQASKNELKDFIDRGLVTSLGDGKGKETKHQKWEVGKERLNYIEKYDIDFISKKFHGTIQNDNLPNGPFWETWSPNKVVQIPEEDHLIINGYANSWVIDTDKLCSTSSFCIKNQDGTYDLELIVEFWPQRLLYFGIFVSGFTLFACLSYLLGVFIKRRMKMASLS